MATPTVARRTEYDVSAAVPAATSPPTAAAAADVPKARRVTAAATANPTKTF